MRKQYTNILKEQFHCDLIHNRAELGITQEEMANRLAMACRTYVDLDHGKNCCSALTLALYLMNVSPDPVAFLAELRNALDHCDEVMP